jgi:hypothetical protein
MCNAEAPVFIGSGDQVQMTEGIVGRVRWAVIACYWSFIKGSVIMMYVVCCWSFIRGLPSRYILLVAGPSLRVSHRDYVA